MAKKNESGRQAARAGGSSGDASLVTRFGDYVMDNRVLIAWALAVFMRLTRYISAMISTS